MVLELAEGLALDGGVVCGGRNEAQLVVWVPGN